MNDEFRSRLLKIREEKLAHLEDLLSIKTRSMASGWSDEALDIDDLVARERAAIDNLDDAIARLN